MEKVNKLLILPIFFLVSFVINCQGAENKSMSHDMSLQKAIEIASSRAVQMGFSLNKMEIIADEKNTSWLENVQHLKSHWERSGILDKLNGRQYWAIHYMPKQLSPAMLGGGDLWVFVDKKNGTIIEVRASQ